MLMAKRSLGDRAARQAAIISWRPAEATGAAHRHGGPIGSGACGAIFSGVMPFLVANLILVAIIIAWPQTALWLVTLMGR